MKKQKTQREILISRLKRGWLNSLQAATECACLKLITRVNEPYFVLHVAGLGYRIESKEIKDTRYVAYRLKKLTL